MSAFEEVFGVRGLLVKMGLGAPSSRAFVAGGITAAVLFATTKAGEDALWPEPHWKTILYMYPPGAILARVRSKAHRAWPPAPRNLQLSLQGSPRGTLVRNFKKTI